MVWDMPKKEKRFLLKNARAREAPSYSHQFAQNHKPKPGEPGALPPSQSEVSPQERRLRRLKGIAGTSPAIFLKNQPRWHKEKT